MIKNLLTFGMSATACRADLPPMIFPGKRFASLDVFSVRTPKHIEVFSVFAPALGVVFDL